ncbi:MAG: HD-GYP domain-containing protein [Acidobacteriota bacterium]|nr:MAG: HD-GYP domain-containing protein [Acidobacteriota bacterium]
MSMALAMETSATALDSRVFLDRSRDALQQLAVLLRNSYLHDLSNQVFEEPLAKLERILGHLLQAEGRFRLERGGEELFANGVRLRMEIRTLHTYKYVLTELQKRDIGGIAFESKPSVEALNGLLEVLSRHRGADVDDELAPRVLNMVNQALSERGINDITLLELREETPVPDDEARAPDRRDRAVNAYQQALDFIRDAMLSVDSPAQVNLRKAKRTVQKLVDLSYEEGSGFSLAGMASIKQHDDYTFNHMVNVCVLAIAFGQRLGLRRQDLAQLGLCALYHDMGKLHIPLDVLNNHTDLSEKEWAVMGNHTVFAARTLFPLIEIDRGTVNRILTALQHHLRFDGTGYPRLRIRTTQSLYARITAIVDTFDAMTTKRIYQRQYLPDEAIALMYRFAGERYDPLLVKAFVNCMGIYPIGSTVALSTGELAVVVESNPDPERIHQPKVRIVTDHTRQTVAALLADLSHPRHKGRAIRHCVDPEKYGINSSHYVL